LTQHIKYYSSRYDDNTSWLGLRHVFKPKVYESVFSNRGAQQLSSPNILYNKYKKQMKEISNYLEQENRMENIWT
jgi:hypothetical protein